MLCTTKKMALSASRLIAISPFDVDVARISRDGEGLSPRGRGKLGGNAMVLVPSRSIPAWAGETSWKAPYHPPFRVYPRVGGGNPSVQAARRTPMGLSPRGRGKPLVPHNPRHAERSIPAWAGETLSAPRCAGDSAVYPRVGGGNSKAYPPRRQTIGLSPRGRGKRRRYGLGVSGQGSIPAWAGETGCVGEKVPSIRVYPRVGGGNRCATVSSASGQGLSPRGRGKPHTQGQRRRR